jgi:hypothetical protein
MKKRVKLRQRAEKMVKMKSVVFLQFFGAKISLKLNFFFIPSQKVVGMTKIGGVLSLKKLPKIQFFTKKSEIALTYAEMTSLSIETIFNPPMAAVGPPWSKIWPPYQVYFHAFNLVRNFEDMPSFARWR